MLPPQYLAAIIAPRSSFALAPQTVPMSLFANTGARLAENADMLHVFPGANMGLYEAVVPTPQMSKNIHGCVFNKDKPLKHGRRALHKRPSRCLAASAP